MSLVFRIPTLSQTFEASSRLWVLMKMVLFSFFSSRMKSLTVFAVSGSRFAVGSSRKRTLGSWIRARAMASFCFIPLENVPTATFLFSQSPSSLRKRSIRSLLWSSGHS